MFPEELARSLPAWLDLASARVVVELRTGLRAGYGQTFLIALGDRWVAASRESVLDPFELVPLRGEAPALVSGPEWDRTLTLFAASGESFMLSVPILDLQMLGRIEALIAAAGSDARDGPDPAPDEPEPVEPAALVLPAEPEEEAPEDPGTTGLEPLFDDVAVPEPLGADPLIVESVSGAEPEPGEPVAWTPGGPMRLQALEERIVEELRKGSADRAVETYALALGAGPAVARNAVLQIASKHGIVLGGPSISWGKVAMLVAIAVGVVLVFVRCP